MKFVFFISCWPHQWQRASARKAGSGEVLGSNPTPVGLIDPSFLWFSFNLALIWVRFPFERSPKMETSPPGAYIASVEIGLNK